MMSRCWNLYRFSRSHAVMGALPLAFCVLLGNAATAEEMTNACPVDGCDVEIVEAKKSGSEITLTLKANIKPNMSKNHIHVWWGENYTIEQVTGNAETDYKVKQGEWHPTDDYPIYVTQSAASTSARGKATTLCVSVSDGNHNILDIKKSHCMDVSGQL